MLAGGCFLSRLVEDFKLLFNNSAAGKSGSSEAAAIASSADAAAPFGILDTLGASLPGVNKTDGDTGAEGGAKGWTVGGVRGLVVNGISQDQAAMLQHTHLWCRLSLQIPQRKYLVRSRYIQHIQL